MIDTKVEKYFFGLDFRPGMDYKGLPMYFPEGAFDLVFGVYYNPLYYKALLASEAEMKAVLAPGGKAMLYTDGIDDIVWTKE